MPPAIRHRAAPPAASARLPLLAVWLVAAAAGAEETPPAASPPPVAAAPSLPPAAPVPAPMPAPAAPRLDDAGRDAQTPSPAGAGRPRALLVEREDFLLSLRGLAQIQGVPWAGPDTLVEAGDAADFPGLRLRRAQLGVEGRAGRHLSFDVWMDLADPALLLLQTRLAWTFRPEISVEAGIVKIPFSRSQLVSSGDLVFAERPLAVNRLVPDRQPGVALYGALFGGRASYRAGVFNGASPAQAGRGNDHPGQLLAGRVAASPLGPLRAGQADLERGAPRVEIAANAWRNGAAGHVSTAWGVDLAAQALGASLLLEYFREVKVPLSQPALPSTLPDRTARYGAIAQASYLIWRDGLEVAVRGERVDDNEGLQDEGDVTAVAAGLRWHVSGNDLLLSADWYRRVELHGRELDNDSVVLGTQGRF